MSNSMIDVLDELGLRLKALALSPTPEPVPVRAAVAENPWFSAEEIRRAALSLASGMLSRDALAEWLARYPTLPVAAADSKNVLVVMAGNIPLVGVHDLIGVIAAGHRAWVKPSSKDAVLMRWVVAQLREIAHDAPVALVDENMPTPDAVIAMGGDGTVAALTGKYAGVPMLLRGHRSSLAILDGNEIPAELEGLADDVLSFSGLGCRNVSLVFVPRGYDFSLLTEALSRRSAGPLNPKYRNNYRQARALGKLDATPHIDTGTCLLTFEKEFPASVSILNYAFYDTSHEVMDWVKIHDPDVQCIVCRKTTATQRIVSGTTPETHPRSVRFGEAQHPTLTDYPDGKDVMQFLAGV